MLDDPDWASIFAPEGRLAEEGERIQRANYSSTLRRIAEEGPEAFYKVKYHVYGITTLI
jgi:gamma-glutamyltranspeptidase